MPGGQISIRMDGRTFVVSQVTYANYYFENHKGILSNQTASYGLWSETNGWWTRILAADFDQ